MPKGELHYGFRRIHGLYQDPAASLYTARTARSLAQQLEQALSTPKIGNAKPAVGAHDSHQPHTRKIVTLGHHLGSQQNVVLPVPEGLQNFVDGPHVLGGVPVHADHLGTRNPLQNFLFQLFDGASHVFVGLRPARKALGIFGIHPVAVMAQKPVVLAVVNQGNMTGLAVQGLAALATNPHLRIPAAVHQHNGLILARHALREGVPQFGRKQNSLLLVHLHHVHNLHLWQRCCRSPLFQSQQLQVALTGVVESFQRGCRRTQHHQGPVLVGQMESQFPRVVAGSRILLLKGTVVFFVQNHHIKIKGGKDSAAGPKNHTGRPFQHRDVGVPFFRSRQRRVQHLHRHFQKAFKPPRRLGRKPDFRHQDKHPESTIQGDSGQFLIHTGLAAARNTVKQCPTKALTI